MGIDFRFAETSDYDRISEFLASHWAEDHVYTRDRALFDWTFGRRSHWVGSGYSFALAEEHGEVVGTLGGIPFTFNDRGRTSEGVWIANYALRPDYRKGATAFKLLDMFRGEPYEVTIACGLNPETTVIYRVLRGRVLPPMPRHVAVLPGRQDRMAALIGTAHPDWDGDRIDRLSAAFTMNTRLSAPEQWGDNIPDCWDAAEWPRISKATIGAARDAQYLRWRYIDHPSFEYKIVTREDAGRTGLAVWRRETINVQEGCTLRPFDDFMRIVEFLPVSKANAGELLGCLVSLADRLNVVGMDFFGYDSWSRQYLNELGMLAVDGEPDGSLIPTRFQPLDGKATQVYNAMFADDRTPECSVGGDCRWYWTKSDSDQDRPN